MLKASESGSSSGKSAKDGLKHVGNTKHLLKATSKNSAYFRKFAALADDWRNFLPRKDTTSTIDDDSCSEDACGVSDDGMTTLPESQGYDLCATRSDTEPESNYEGSTENSDSENESGKSVASKRPPSKKAGKCTSQRPFKSSAIPSSAKESLHKEELCHLLSSTTLDKAGREDHDIEDVLREIEPEFSLCLDDSDGLESEDSLTCLVKDYEKRYSSDGTMESDRDTHFLSSTADPEASSGCPIPKRSLKNRTRSAKETEDERDKVGTHQKTAKNSRPALTLQTAAVSGIAPGALTSFEKPFGSQFSLTKCNSTSSLYIDSTMAKSDVERPCAHSHRLKDCRTERIINSSSNIFDFMRFIFECGQNLGAENAIITHIYLERMTELGNLSFHAINWRRLLLGALVLSIKVWEDLAVFNSDVCAIFEGLYVKDVNALERFSMAKLQYNVSVKRSVYAAYYFRLRDISEQQHNEHYGKLALSRSQRRIQGCIDGGGSQALMVRNDSYAGYSKSGNSAGLMGLRIAGSSSGSLSNTHRPKVPVGPGYRKWTLKPLSVREADRLEARSSLYTSNMMMEAQERRDAGCCLDEYSCATPEELHNLSAALLITSIPTVSSMASVLTNASSATTQSHGTIHNKSNHSTLSTSSSISSTETKVAGSIADLAATEGETGSQSDSAQGSTEPPKRTLRLKKSRSDFFFQNTTPVSIM
ncbi:MAG: hypothetical protein J3Q66DRAFT_416169 [Benniella sp.]|nr:MAG: hypothetical protein J3Q66DRAFT_416169 [Benniella sp.]